MKRAIFQYADGRNIHQNIEDGPPTYRVVEFGPSEPGFHQGWRPPDMIIRDFHETKLYTRDGVYVLSLFSEVKAWGADGQARLHSNPNPLIHDSSNPGPGSFFRASMSE